MKGDKLRGPHRGAAAGQAAAAHGAPRDPSAEAAALAEAHHRVHKRLQPGALRLAASTRARADCLSTRRAWPCCCRKRLDAPSHMARYCTRSGRLRASSHSSASPATCVGAVAPPAAAARYCGVVPVRLLHDAHLDVAAACWFSGSWHAQ